IKSSAPYSYKNLPRLPVLPQEPQFLNESLCRLYHSHRPSHLLLLYEWGSPNLPPTLAHRGRLLQSENKNHRFSLMLLLEPLYHLRIPSHPPPLPPEPPSHQRHPDHLSAPEVPYHLFYMLQQIV